MDNMTFIQGIDATFLTFLVRKALHSKAIEVVEWQANPIHGGATTNASIYRLTGCGNDQGQAISWSLILKIWHWREDRDDPLRWNYWKREALAYQSGLLDTLPGELIAPRCLGVDERPDKSIWLWLEDITGANARPWSLTDFGTAAYQLGNFNGAYLAGRPMPTYSWLSYGWLRAWVAFCSEAIAALPAMLEHPLVRELYPVAAAKGFSKLWAERDMFLEALDRLPQTFCHRDAFVRNLFLRRGFQGADEIVAIDWANAGRGFPGEEVAALVGGSLVFFEAEPSAARELDEIAFAQYLEGLRRAGWSGDSRIARFGYTTALALRYGLGGALDVGIAADESTYEWAEQVLGHPIRELVERTARLSNFFLERADEARQLLGILC